MNASIAQCSQPSERPWMPANPAGSRRHSLSAPSVFGTPLTAFRGVTKQWLRPVREGPGCGQIVSAGRCRERHDEEASLCGSAAVLAVALRIELAAAPVATLGPCRLRLWNERRHSDRCQGDSHRQESYPRAKRISQVPREHRSKQAIQEERDASSSGAHRGSSSSRRHHRGGRRGGAG